MRLELPKKQAGYLTALFGGISGALLLMVLNFFLGKVYGSQFVARTELEGALPVVLAAIIGASL